KKAPILPEGLCWGDVEIIDYTLTLWGRFSERESVRHILERRARNGRPMVEIMKGVSRLHFFVHKYVKDKWNNKAVPRPNEFFDSLWNRDPSEWMPQRMGESPAPMATRSIWDDEPTGDLI